jgi:hypothetical protein
MKSKIENIIFEGGVNELLAATVYSIDKYSMKGIVTDVLEY